MMSTSKIINEINRLKKSDLTNIIVKTQIETLRWVLQDDLCQECKHYPHLLNEENPCADCRSYSNFLVINQRQLKHLKNKECEPL